MLGKDKDQIKKFQNPNMYGFVCVSLVLHKASRIDKANIESLVRRGKRKGYKDIQEDNIEITNLVVKKSPPRQKRTNSVC